MWVVVFLLFCLWFWINIRHCLLRQQRIGNRDTSSSGRSSMCGIESIKSRVKLVLSFVVAAVNFGVPPGPKSSGAAFRVGPRTPEGFSQYSPSTFSFHLHCALATKEVSPLYTLTPRPMLDCCCLLLGNCWPRGRKGLILCCPDTVSVAGRSCMPCCCDGAFSVIFSLFPMATKLWLVALASFMQVSFLFSSSNETSSSIDIRLWDQDYFLPLP